MPPPYDTTHLMELLRHHTRAPATLGLDDEGCLRDLTAILHGYVLPLVKAEWQGHWASIDSATALLPLVNGQAEYSIPSRAVASSIQKATLVGPNGQRVKLTYLETERREEWPDKEGQPAGYTVRGNRLYLYPTPTNMQDWYLRLPMLVRPAALVLPEACALVSSVGAAVDGVVQLTFSPAVVPEDIENTSIFDMVRGTEPYETVLLEFGAVFINDQALEVPEATAASIQPGDWLCLPGTSPFPQCPVELLNVLAQRVAMEQLASIGDGDIAAAKASSLGEQRSDARALVKPRTGEPRLRRNGMAKWGGTGGGWT